MTHHSSSASYSGSTGQRVVLAALSSWEDGIILESLRTCASGWMGCRWRTHPPWVGPASVGEPLQHQGDFGIYGLIDQQIFRNGGKPDSGVYAFARVAASPS